MSDLDLVAGRPVHAVARLQRRVTPGGARVIDWIATCGATGTASTALGYARAARPRELCPACWPDGHRTFHLPPLDTTSPAHPQP